MLVLNGKLKKKKRRLTINPGSYDADEGKTCDELSDIK
jgi:hypothetical protein